MKHLFSTRVKVLIIAAILISAGLAILSGATNQSIPSIVVQGILTPFRAGANALTKQAEQLYGYMFRYEALSAENEALKKQISQMEDDARQADSYYRENQRLRDALALTQTREDFVLVDAYIIAWGTTDWNSTVTVSKGSNAGIESGMCAIIANGDTVRLALEAAEALEAKGVKARVLDMHTIKPLDEAAVKACIDEIGRIVTVEDHNILNGLGSAVCELVAEAGKGRVKRIGIRDQFGQSAPYERLLAMNGVTAEDIAAAALGEW